MAQNTPYFGQFLTNKAANFGPKRRSMPFRSRQTSTQNCALPPIPQPQKTHSEMCVTSHSAAFYRPKTSPIPP